MLFNELKYPLRTLTLYYLLKRVWGWTLFKNWRCDKYFILYSFNARASSPTMSSSHYHNGGKKNTNAERVWEGSGQEVSYINRP